MLHALILAGGAGTRLWPKSRRGRPKHLLALEGEETLLQATAGRLAGAVEAVWVVTTNEQAEPVREALPGARVVVEPGMRDTAAALGLGAAAIAREDPEAVICIMPADHVIRPASRLRAAAETAARLLSDHPDAVVTLGIPPSAPATGYGYIERGEPLAPARPATGRPTPAGFEQRVFQVRAFREKPDAETAQRYTESGEHYWNAGIFIWRGQALLEALERFLPETAAAVRLEGEALARAYEALPKISIDYAVLEKHEQVLVIEADFEWSDIGSFTALVDIAGQDADGNTTLGAPHIPIDAKRILVWGDKRLVATIGVEDLVIVDTDDALLVCHRDRVQDVKRLVQELERQDRGELL